MPPSPLPDIVKILEMLPQDLPPHVRGLATWYLAGLPLFTCGKPPSFHAATMAARHVAAALALTRTGGSISHASVLAGVSRRAFRQFLKAEAMYPWPRTPRPTSRRGWRAWFRVLTRVVAQDGTDFGAIMHTTDLRTRTRRLSDLVGLPVPKKEHAALLRAAEVLASGWGLEVACPDMTELRRDVQSTVRALRNEGIKEPVEMIVRREFADGLQQDQRLERKYERLRRNHDICGQADIVRSVLQARRPRLLDRVQDDALQALVAGWATE